MTVQITNRLRPAIHPTYPRLLCAYLHERGFDNAVIFQDTRLQWEQLLGDHRYLSLEQMSRLIRRAIDLTGQPWIGLETAGVTSVSAHGPLGYAVVSAPDLREVLRVVSRYVGVRFQLVGVRFEEFDDHAVLTLDEQVDLAEIREMLVFLDEQADSWSIEAIQERANLFGNAHAVMEGMKRLGIEYGSEAGAPTPAKRGGRGAMEAQLAFPSSGSETCLPLLPGCVQLFDECRQPLSGK